jgi:hypothetical protein
MKYTFKCVCGVSISSDTERQLEILLERHSRNSSIHKERGLFK